MPQRLAYQSHEAIFALAVVYGLCGHQNLHPSRHRDHVAAFTARSIPQPAGIDTWFRTNFRAGNLNGDCGGAVRGRRQGSSRFEIDGPCPDSPFACSPPENRRISLRVEKDGLIGWNWAKIWLAN